MLVLMNINLKNLVRYLSMIRVYDKYWDIYTHNGALQGARIVEDFMELPQEETSEPAKDETSEPTNDETSEPTKDETSEPTNDEADKG